jgi:hypothetical protein
LKAFFKSVFNQKTSDSFRDAVTLCALVGAIGLLDGCSFEKELPSVCVSDDKIVIRELCRSYGGKTQENGKKETLLEHGFNERDAEAIYLYITGKSISCRVTVARQCDLIVMRNGVGY